MAGLYQMWEQATANFASENQRVAFYEEYFALEQKVYEQLLDEAQTNTLHEGTVNDVAVHFDMDPVAFAAFIDGINTSLAEPIPLDDLQRETEIVMDVDLDKLYMNMRDASAKHLYTLPQWDNLRTPAERLALRKKWQAARQAVAASAAGRNDPCPCGSGKKYKKCCWDKDHAPAPKEEAGTAAQATGADSGSAAQEAAAVSE